MITFIPYRESTWRVTGMARASQAESFLGRTLVTTRSFRPLGDEERASIVSTKLAIVEARPGERLTALSERTGNAWELAQLALYNGVVVNHRFGGGELVKIVQTLPYTSAKETPKEAAGP